MSLAACRTGHRFVGFPILAELLHERERSSFVRPANGRGQWERAQLGNCLAHDAFMRLDERRFVRLRKTDGLSVTSPH